MNISDVNGYSLKDLDKINIILGKNGCGKSTLLRQVEAGLSGQTDEWSNTKYITPERGGSLVFEGGVEQSITTDINWTKSRSKNQFNQFRQQSFAQFRRLKELVLEEIEQVKDKRTDESYTFDVYMDELNSLLDNIEIRRSQTHFTIYSNNGQPLQPDAISSGESELISLGIECLIFERESKSNKKNMLFLDEPDVHLHPDLQVRLMDFLKELVETGKFIVLIATHSTAILGALHDYANTRIAFMDFNQKDLTLQSITDTYRRILPVFGAHPLSNLFNEAPVLLVEGEDDERIWQQAVRSSDGRLKLHPCACDGMTNLNLFETEVVSIIKAVYDDAKAYSIRDLDDSDGQIEDMPPLVRCKLSCRNAENLLLTDEVLSELSISWDDLKDRLNNWSDMAENQQHPHYQLFQQFRADGYNRKEHNVKEARNTLMGIIGSSKPWEVAVGKVIGSLSRDTTKVSQSGSIYDFLGMKIVSNVLS